MSKDSHPEIDPILASLAGRGLGLIYGSGLSLNLQVSSDCLQSLKNDFPTVKVDSLTRHYYDFVRSAQEQGLQVLPIQQRIRTFFDACPPNPQLSRVAKAPWKAVISLAEDRQLPILLATHFNSLVTSKTFTKVSSLDVVPEGHTLPHFSLLGDIVDARPQNRLATTRAEYLARRRIWRQLVATAPDFLYGVPILLAGTLPCVEMLIDFLNEMLSIKPTLSSKLLLLSDDPLRNNAEFKDIVAERFQIIELNIGLSDVIEFLAQSRDPIAQQASFDFTDAPYDPAHLKAFSEQVFRVPLASELSAIAGGETPRLLDILFSPAQLDWLPYKAKLDFGRDLTPLVIAQCANVSADEVSNERRIVALRGESGVGKTIALRRIAFDLAQERKLVLWLRKSYAIYPLKRWEDLIRGIEKAVSNRKCRVVLIYDDPASGNIAPQDLLNLLNSAKFDWILVTCIRNSDRAGDRSSHGFMEWTSNAFEFPTHLSPEEVMRLPKYLVDIGAAKDILTAQGLTRSNAGNYSSDILCALWYLLPSTRAAISQSISDEYQRLGGFKEAVSSFAAAVHTKAGIARHAYELVATATGLNMVVPVEVLVRALGIEYQEWIDMCSSQKPIWGLIYEVTQPNSETYGFRTRNEVVTQVLLQLLNGGLGVRTGEFRCLKSLVGACSVGAPAYYGFLVELLVKNRTSLSDIASYEQGLELYDLAVKEFPRPVRSLLHHRALWIKDVGNHTAAAYAALEEASQTPAVGPLPEPEEFVFTSMAATIVKAVREGSMTPGDALTKVEDLLSKATRPGSLNLHNQHVHASLLLELATRLRGEDAQAFLSSLQIALRMVDHSLTLLCPKGAGDDAVSKGYEMMKELRIEIIDSHTDLNEAKDAALQVYKGTRNQAGFALVARKMIALAETQNKGSMFKAVAEYLKDVAKVVESMRDELVADVLLTRAENIWRWRVARRAGAVEWQDICNDLEAVVSTPRYRNDYMVMFWLAVSHFTLKDFGAAASFFARLRDNHLPRHVRHSQRSILLDHQGSPRRLQVELKQGADTRLFAYSADLDTSIIARAPDFRGTEHSAAHCYVVFTMEGPLAVRMPDPNLADRMPIDRTVK